MNYWQTDPDTGILISPEPIPARQDPRTEGHWFVPRGGSVVPPPALEPRQAAVWDGEDWTVIEDWRCRSGWIDGKPVEIVDVGPLPEGWSDTAPQPAPPAPRELARAELASQWAALPAWIRGPFGATYAAAVSLLDQGDDEAAAALIQYADAPTGYSIEQVAAFGLIRDELLAAITALPQH